jgi:DHA1 family multidrug resistance protein-like MFS transporter
MTRTFSLRPPRLRQMAYWQRVLWIMFFAQFVSQMGFAVTFPFLPLYVAELGTHTAISIEFWAGAVFGAQAFTMMLASPFWGAVADRYGRKLMMQRALFGGTILLAMMAFVGSAEELVILRAIQGCITGTISAANSLVAAVAPRHRIGYAMGVLIVGQWGGLALGPIIGGPLADAYGYRMPQLITAGLLLLSGLMVQFGVREEFTPELKAANKARGFVGEYRHILAMPGIPQTYGISFLNALSRSMIAPIAPLFVAVLMAGALGAAGPVYAGLGLFDALPHLEAALNGGAQVSTITGLIVGVSSATMTFSAVYFGRLGDRVGHRTVLVVCSLIAMVSLIPQVFVTEAWQLIVLQALTGVASGGLLSAPSALLARHTEPGLEGAVYGLDNSVVSAGRTVSPLLGGAIAAWFGYRAAFGSLVVVYALMAAFALLLIPSRRAAPSAPPTPEPARAPDLPADLQPQPAGD